MKNIYKILTSVIIVSILSACCFGNPDWAVSPNRINIDKGELSDEIKKIHDLCDSMPGNCISNKLEIVGHGAASFRYYPMGIDKDGKVKGNSWSVFKNAKAKNVVDLMDIAFRDHNIEAIEIDVQLPKTSHPLCKIADKQNCAFVMHNTPDWKMISNENIDSFRYFQNNTLNIVLSHFMNQNYHTEGKRVYLELKSSLDCTSPDQERIECTDDAFRVANIVKQILSKTNSSESTKNWLIITSFSATALSALREKLEEQFKNQVDYALIAGYDTKGFLGIKSCLAQCKGPVPQFTKEMQDFASLTPWLNKLWFSTKGISNPIKIFDGVVSKRSKLCKLRNNESCEKLLFCVANYDQSENKFREIMNNSDEPFTHPLVSIMIDIDEEFETP